MERTASNWTHVPCSSPMSTLYVRDWKYTQGLQTGVKVLENAVYLLFPWLPLCQTLSPCCIFSELQFAVVFL